jgi:hypothetical protein
MTVVVNEQNKAYILKQQVAEGYTLDSKTQVVKNGLVYNKADDAPIAANPTDINNWLSVGTDFSGDITGLDSRIDTLELFKDEVTDNLSVKANSGLSFNADHNLQVKLVEDSDEFINGLHVSNDGLWVPSYTFRAIDSTKVEEGYASQYEFTTFVPGADPITTKINIPKDQFLKSATFHATAEEGVAVEAPYLKFVWDLDINPDLEGIQNVTYVPVKDLVDTYTAGDYITINNNVVSVDINSLTAQIKTDISYDEITSNIDTLTTAVGDDKSGLIADVAKNTSDISSINEVLTPLSATVEGHSTTIAQHTSSIQNLGGKVTVIMSGALTHVDDTASHGIKLEYSDKDLEGDWTAKAVKVSVDLEALREDLQVDADSVLLTTDIKDSENAETARYETGDSVQSILADLNARVLSINTDIESALGEGLIGIEAGKGIAVDATTNKNKPSVSVKVAANSALKTTTDGLDIFWSEL